MDYKSLFEFFHKVETEYPVQKWMVGGIHIWPLVRIQMGAVFSAGRSNTFSSINEHAILASNNWWNYMKSVSKPLVDELKLFFLDFKHRERLAPCDVVMLGDAADRNVQMPTGELMDHNLDPIYEALQTEGYRIFKFEEMHSDGPRYPRWTRSYIINGMMLWAKIRRKWDKGTIKDIQINADLYRSIMQSFSRLQPGNEPILLEYVIHNAIYVRFLADEFQEKLKILKPRLVVLECWYSLDKMALSIAAHKMGISVVDVQHGVAGGSDSHQAYIDWHNMPRKGYEVMPDYIWGWEQADCDAIARWGEDKVTPIFGGRPMNLIWGNKAGEIPRYYKKEYEKEFGSPRPTILLTLQWGIKYPEWFLDFVNQMDKYTWLIRLHPVVDENERAFLEKLEKKENIIWVGVDSFPLDVLLTNAWLHITMYSSAVIEAEEVGCHSIVIHPFACQAFAMQIKRGMVRYADNPKDLLAAIHDDLSKRVQMRDNVGRMKELYVQGQSGIRRLIEIMESHQSCYML